MGGQQEVLVPQGPEDSLTLQPVSLGNIHPDGQVGQDWGKKRPLLGDTASQQDDENVTTEELREPEASAEEMLSGNFSAMSFISVAQNFMMDAMCAAYIDKFA